MYRYPPMLIWNGISMKLQQLCEGMFIYHHHSDGTTLSFKLTRTFSCSFVLVCFLMLLFIYMELWQCMSLQHWPMLSIVPRLVDWWITNIPLFLFTGKQISHKLCFRNKGVILVVYILSIVSSDSKWYLLHLYNRISPVVARKTDNQAQAPTVADIMKRWDAAGKTVWLAI